MFIQLFLLSLGLHSPARADTLFDYVVYTKEGIEAECSDYLGRTASAGPIKLRDFLIKSEVSKRCSLESNSSIQTQNGAVMSGEARSCIATRNLADPDWCGTAYSYQAKPIAPFLALNAQMDLVSKLLSAQPSTRLINQVTTNLRTLAPTKTITITGPTDRLYVMNITDVNPELVGYGVLLVGGVNPSNIVWNFPNATSLKIMNAGTVQNGYGIPGTFIAPKAVVTFNNARITGAIYAKKLIGHADRQDCSNIVSGQVNPTCLWSPIPGIGCDQSQQQQGQDQ